MKSFWLKIFTNLIVILFLFGLVFYFKDELKGLSLELVSQFQPCKEPITYSVSGLDSRFGLTEEEMLQDIKKAEMIWESAVNKDLFRYSPDGDIKISLIYDYRQQATEELRKMGIVIKRDKATYESLEARYDSLVSSYNSQKSYLDGLVQEYQKDRSAYEKEVRYWNSRGGAPKKEYDALQQMKNDLDNQLVAINRSQSSLNQLADSINSLASALNGLVARLNLQVNAYNSVGASTGREFSEGEYVIEGGSRAINIFQFNDEDNLIRVLAHEFGHSLGLDHLDNPEAIMYRLNEGTDNNLSSDDIRELNNLCGIE